MAAAEALLVRAARDADARGVIALLEEAELESAFDPREFVVADAGGRVVACARLRTFPTGAHELASVAVARPLRGTGIGARVVTAALERATGPVYALALAAGFFAKLGFTPMLRTPPELEEKASTLCASSGFVAMRHAPGGEAAVAEIRRRYAAIATGEEQAERAERGCCGPECCAGGDRAAKTDGACCAGSCCGGADAYTVEELAALPPGAHLGLGTGNPVREADLREGETVLDLGAGAGVDVLLAARAVGPRGRAIGIDLTPEMVARARANAERAGVGNAEFLEAPMERIPLPDASVDAVISNCVVNLSVDKPAVLREAFRVLREGGRFVVSDTLRLPGSPSSAQPSCDCTAGALSVREWRSLLAAAGFDGIEMRAGPARGSVGTATVVARKART